MTVAVSPNLGVFIFLGFVGVEDLADWGTMRCLKGGRRNETENRNWGELLPSVHTALGSIPPATHKTSTEKRRRRH